MSKRNSYKDTFTGETDRGIRALLGCDSDENDNIQRLRRVLLKVINNELTPRQKEIIMLYYFKDYDIPYIGKSLNVSPQAVSAVMSRARVRMLKVLQYYI